MLATDQATKALVTRVIPPGAAVPVIPDAVTLTHVSNPGVAFSLLPEVPWLVPAAVAAVLLVLLFGSRTAWTADGRAQVALALLCGGALGNLIDRVRTGAVIDYLDLGIWPVFNLADVAITAGAALLLVSLVRTPPSRSR